MTRRELIEYLEDAEVAPDDVIEIRVSGETVTEVEAERAGVYYVPVEIDAKADVNDIKATKGKAVITLWI